MINARSRPTHGFTLMELLVVIAIITILIAVVLPLLKQARHVARRTVATSNLRQVGLAMDMYTSSHDGWYPNVWGNPGAKPGLEHRLLPFLETSEVFRDPDDTLETGFFSRFGTSFNYCSWGSGPTNINNPSQQRVVLMNFRDHQILRPSTKAAVRDLGPEFGLERTGYLFVDSHVQRMPASPEGTLAWWQYCDAG